MASPSMPGTAYVALPPRHGRERRRARRVGICARRDGRAHAGAGVGGPRPRCRGPLRRRGRADPRSRRQAVGVALANGDEYHAPVVASNADANVTFLRLLERSALPEAFVADVERISYASASLKINVALAELPDFERCPAPSQARSIAARSTSVPTRTTSSGPSTTLSTAAPPQSPCWSARSPRRSTRRSRADRHLMSMFVQYARTSSATDSGTTTERPSLTAASTCSTSTRRTSRAPSSIARCSRRRTSTRLQPDGRQHLPGRDDSVSSSRSVPCPATRYRTPVAGLYLCGAAATPAAG